MNKKFLVATIIACFFFLVVVLPQISYCQTSTPSSTTQPTPAKAGILGSTSALLLIGGIIAVVAVVVVVTFVFVFKKRRNEKSLNGGVSSR